MTMFGSNHGIAFISIVFITWTSILSAQEPIGGVRGPLSRDDTFVWELDDPNAIALVQGAMGKSTATTCGDVLMVMDASSCILTESSLLLYPATLGPLQVGRRTAR